MHSANNYRTLVISERLPFDLEKGSKLSTTVAPVLGNGCLWMGHDLTDGDAVLKLSLPIQVVPVQIDQDTFSKHTQFCNKLWNLFHLHPSHCDENNWTAYQQVNNEFGKKALAVLKTTARDIVWLQNYQLMLAALPIRQSIIEEEVSCKVGFFLHTPFPPWYVLKQFPNSDELLQGVLASDFVGLNTLSYCQNFLNCCRLCLGCRVDEQRWFVEHNGRAVAVKPLTLGIDFDHFSQPRGAVPTPSNKVIVTFDRCTQSIVQKLAAFAHLLKYHRQHVGNVTMHLVINSKNNLHQETIDKFNADFGKSNWCPVYCTYGYRSQSELESILQTADVCLVTPPNGGLSLIAKEYVACQTNEVPGVLVLSSTSANAESMPEAISANINSPTELSQALHRGLSIPDNEKIIRMTFLRKREKLNNILSWKNSFLNAVLNSTDTMPDFSPSYFEQYLGGWIKPKNDVVLLLDYDGTLAPTMSHPDLSVLPTETKACLQKLHARSDCYVAVISGRSVNNVMKMVGVDGITYAGNHGLEILFPDGSKFVYPITEGICEQVEKLHGVLEEKLCHDGAWVENKGTSLTFHYCDGPVDFRKAFDAKAKVLIEEAGFKSEHGHLAVEAKPIVQWNKGRAALYILEKTYGTDWTDKVNVIYAGDDVTDEDAMRILKGVAATIRVTSLSMTKTSAQRRIPNSKAVLVMLKWVEQYLNTR